MQCYHSLHSISLALALKLSTVQYFSSVSSSVSVMVEIRAIYTARLTQCFIHPITYQVSLKQSRGEYARGSLVRVIINSLI